MLTDSKGNVAEWSLTAVVDVYGNYIRYNYSKDYSCKTRKDIEKYIESIEYTGNVNTQIEPAYSVRFLYNDQRKDTIYDGRLGFLRQTARTMCTILIECQDKPIASYVMDYDSCSAQTLNKMRLKAITKYDAHDIQCRHIDIRTPEWTEYDKLSLTNEFLNKIETGLLENDVNAEKESIPGSRTSFDYCNAVSINDLFKVLPKTTSLENLGENVNQTFGGGSSFVVGIGCNVGETSNSVGMNFDINYGLGKTNAMMIDLNGDGLPDYVRDNGQTVSYKRQNQNGDFDDFVTINGLTNLVREHNLSYSLGVQASFGVQLSASPLAFSNSFTDTYFADVNSDHLPDLITPSGVMINHLDDNGNPTFELLTGDLIETTSRKCGKIVRNGAVDPRLECELSYVYDQFIPWEKICANSFFEGKEEKKPEEDKAVEDLESHVSEIPVGKLVEKYHPKECEYIINSDRSLKYDDEIPISLPIPQKDEKAYSDMKEEQIIRYPD